MKIVIDIPEEVKQTFDNAKNEDLYDNYYDYNSLIGKAIRNGTPIPKGCGRLIDADAYIDKHEECGWLDDISVDEFNTITPTIIEANKAESEE